MMKREIHVFDVVLSGIPGAPRAGKVAFPAVEGELDANDAASGLPASAPPRFEYDREWLRSGFPIGGDVPLVEGVHVPMARGRRSGLMLFGFLAERAAPHRLELMEAGVSGNDPDAGRRRRTGVPDPVDPPIPSNAGREEAAAVHGAHAIHHAGGVSIRTEDGKTLGRILPPPASPDIERLLYALHAEERGRAKDDERRLVDRAALFPETEPGTAPELLIERKRQFVRAIVPSLSGMSEGFDGVLWGTIGLKLATAAGIPTVLFESETVLGTPVRYHERLDRAQGRERLVLSAATLLSKDRPMSWLALADLLNSEGAAPKEDLPLIWERIALTLLTGATDGASAWKFVREAYGWRLLPLDALTLSPYPTGRPVTVDGRRVLRSVEEWATFAKYFAMTPSDAKRRLAGMRRVLFEWEDAAREAGADPKSINAMRGAMDL